MFKKLLLSILLAIAITIGGFYILPSNTVLADSVDLYWIPVSGSGTGNWSETAHWATIYTTGTASFVNGDATVEFGGGADVTSYDDCIIRVLSTGKWYTIDSITDSDTLELTGAFAEANTGAVAYAIAIDGHAVPTATNNVYFNIGSFTTSGQTVTIDATAYFKDMDWTGATNNPTMAIGALHISAYGNVTFTSDMTINATSWGWYIDLMGNTTQELTCAGVTGNKLITQFNTASNLSLQDDLTCGLIDFTRGSITTNNYNITAVSTNSNWGIQIKGTTAKTMNLGSSVITTSEWDYEASGLTLNEGTSTINCSGAFNGNGETYNIVNLTGATSTVSGSNTYAELNLDDTKTQTITFTAGTTQTITNDSNLEGSAGHVHTLTGTGEWYLNYTGIGYLAQDYLNITNSSVTPARTWIAGSNSTDSGGNSGWAFADAFVPLVSTSDATNVLAEQATGNGSITSTGGLNSTTIGFDWGTTSGVYTGEVTEAGSFGIGVFSNTLTPLEPATTIYYRAKAENAGGWGYGEEKTFTLYSIGMPTNLEVSINGVLTWIKGQYATDTLIVRGTGDYPTTITDGTVIYSGADLTVTDVNYNPETSTYYYSAWGKSGTYYSPNYAIISLGGGTMVLIGFIAFAGILSFLAFYNTFPLLKLLAGASWIAVFIYFKDNPPSMIAEGDTAHTAILVILMGLAIAIPLAGLGRDMQRQKIMQNGGIFKTNEFKWRFGKDRNEYEGTIMPHRETAEEYRAKVHSALRRK